jgi:hypothetical protein
MWILFLLLMEIHGNDLEKYIYFNILNSFWSILEQISIWSLWSTALTQDCSHLVCFIYILVLPCFLFLFLSSSHFDAGAMSKAV